MYFLLSMYCCAYINLIIYKTKDKISYLVTYLSLIAGVLNMYHFIFVNEISTLNLVVYTLNTLVSLLFVYIVKDYKVNFKNPNMVLFDLSVHITAVLTLIFSVINILEFYGLV